MLYVLLSFFILASGCIIFGKMLIKRRIWLSKWFFDWLNLLEKTAKKELTETECLLVQRAIRAFPQVEIMFFKVWIWDIEKFIVDREAFNFILEKNNVQINSDFSKEF